MGIYSRSSAYNVGKSYGQMLNNTSFGKSLNSVAQMIGNSFTQYGNAINKAAQQTVYGNMDSPYATTGGFVGGLYKSGGGMSSGLKGAGSGLLLEFGVRSANNIYQDILKDAAKDIYKDVKNSYKSVTKWTR